MKSNKKILILHSTELEISELKKYIDAKTNSDDKNIYIFENIGVGQTFASVLSYKAIEKHNPDIVLNIGIAGAFKQSGLRIDDIVLVQNDIIENGKDTGEFIEQYSFEKAKYYIENKTDKVSTNIDLTSFSDLKRVSSLTISLVASNKEFADKRYNTYKADIETMEGGSIAFVMNEFFPETPFFQIRSISNLTGELNIEKNNLLSSIKNLNNYFISIKNS